MANFFDDEADDDDDDASSSHQVASRAVTAGPSRRPAVNAEQSRSTSRYDDISDDEDELPPPLALRNNNNNDKGKGRAVSAAAPAYGGAARHARASSTMSIDNYHDNHNARQGAAANGRRSAAIPQRQRQQSRGGGGFLADDNDEDDPSHYGNGNGNGNGNAPEDDDEEELDGDGGIKNESDIQHLLRLYMDERMAPELLRWNEGLISRLMQNLEAQTEAASVLLSSGATSKPDEHERLLLVQMEIERVRWLLRSYLRTRTFKIEKQAQYLLRTPLAKAKMSDVEQGYAERYHSLVIKHFQNSVTGNIPERLGRLDEDEMVVRPELDQAVFARARRDCPPITLPDTQLLEMKKGEIHLVRYKSVRALVRDGYVRLV